MAYEPFSLCLLAIIPVLFVVLGLLMWSWSCFLDRHEHVPARVRLAMLWALVLAMSVEAGLCFFCAAQPAVVLVCLFANLWGGLDAVLRFPVAHALESCFGMKQLALIGAKTFAFLCSSLTRRASLASILAVLLVDVWGLPLLYVMAVPTTSSEEGDALDVDLLVRAWRFAFCWAERRRCIEECQSWWYRNLTSISEHSKLGRLAVCVASAEHRRSLKRRDRRV